MNLGVLGCGLIFFQITRIYNLWSQSFFYNIIRTNLETIKKKFIYQHNHHRLPYLRQCVSFSQCLVNYNTNRNQP